MNLLFDLVGLAGEIAFGGVGDGFVIIRTLKVVGPSVRLNGFALHHADRDPERKHRLPGLIRHGDPCLFEGAFRQPNDGRADVEKSTVTAAHATIVLPSIEFLPHLLRNGNTAAVFSCGGGTLVVTWCEDDPVHNEIENTIGVKRPLIDALESHCKPLDDRVS